MTASSTTVEMGNNAAYQNKLMNLVKGRDPLEVLGRTPDVLAKFVTDHDAATLRARPFPGKWTPLEIIGHLVDAEYVYAYRVRMILCEPTPTIHGMDQELWVTGQRYNEREPSELINEFRALRQTTLRFWKTVRPEELNRFGRHAERGEESLGTMLRMHAGHDLSHIDQITRYLAVIQDR